MADTFFITSTGEQIPIVITTRRGLRNVTLRPRVAPAREIHVSKPWLCTDKYALGFIEQKRRWLERIFAAAPQKHTVAPGDVIEFLDRRVKLVHDASLRGNDFIQNDDGTFVLAIGGGADMFERRVRDFIKAEFLKTARAMVHDAPRDLWPVRIAVRDTTSRWGSCSTSGTRSFSWRLAFAPTDVMRYVVMHELAHRRHMDHSPEFWATVRELYGFGVERAKRWLAKNGGTLHQYF